MQPLRQHPDVAGQPTRPGFVPPRERQFGDEVAIVTTASAIDPGLQPLAPRCRAFGKTRERVGQARTLAQNVKHIAVARRLIAPGRPLSGAQALPGIGDRVVRLQPACTGVEQMHTPGIGVAMLFRNQKVAVSGRGINAGQNRCRALEDLVVQADANTRQILPVVDNARLPRGGLKRVVHGTHTDGHTQQVADELDNATIRAVADQRQRHDHLVQPGFRHRQIDLLVQATAANAGVYVRDGSGTNELDITTGGTVALNSGDNNLTVLPDAVNATLTLNHMTFIHAEGSGGDGVIIAGAAGQVLTGGGAGDTLEDAGQYGVTFQDTIAGIEGDTLADFSKVDTIDLTNLGSVTASPIYTGGYGAASSGVLALTDGTGTVDIKLTGLTAGGSFNATTDLHGGTLITYA